MLAYIYIYMSLYIYTVPGGEPLARVALPWPSRTVRYALPELQRAFVARLEARGLCVYMCAFACGCARACVCCPARLEAYGLSLL